VSIPSNSLPAKDDSPRLDFLEGVVVLELASSVAAPFATQLLADLGATVIKIEQPGQGDDCRSWGPPFIDDESLWFISVNRNKSSVTLNYSHPAGYKVLTGLIEKADVVLLNQVPRVQEKLKVDYEQLKAINPAIIHASITGFGLQGSRCNMPCYDLIAEGYSGVMDMTGELGGPPQKIGTPAADLLAGEDAALAILAALFRKSRRQIGCQIDVSLVESMTRFMSPRLVPYLGSGEPMTRSGATDSVIAIYQVFNTLDLPLTLGLGNNNIWSRFWEAVGEKEVVASDVYSTNARRREKRSELVEKISDVLKDKSRDQWLQIFSDHRVPAGPVYSLAEVAKDAEHRKNGFLYQIERNGFHLPQVGMGIRFDGASEGCYQAPPRLGEHTRAVLTDYLAMDAQEIERLEDENIV
jgi:crotonobetainyl-CoA:carnitine CoA-transferase CaiB-like acyl-CoA transferase